MPNSEGRITVLCLLLAITVSEPFLFRPPPPPASAPPLPPPQPPPLLPPPPPAPPKCAPPIINVTSPSVKLFACTSEVIPDITVWNWTDVACCGGPGELMFTDDKDGVSNTCAQSVSRYWSLVDGCHRETGGKQQIRVLKSPDYRGPPDKLINCAVNSPFDLRLTGVPVAVGCKGAKSNVNHSDIGDIQTYINRTWTVADQCAHRVQVFTQIIRCCTPPSLNVTSLNETLDQCDIHSTPNITEPIVETGSTPCCGGTVNVTFTDRLLSSSSCSTQLERLWLVQDSCNNTHNATQVITIRKPQNTYRFPPAIRLLCDRATPEHAGQVIGSGCIPYNATYEDQTDGLVINRTWTISDQCAPPIAHVQLIQCCQPPAFTDTENSSLSFTQCDLELIPEVPSPQFTTDDICCSGNRSLSVDDNVILWTNCSHHIQRTWTMTDGCGRSINRTRIIRIDKPPNQYEPPRNMIQNCLSSEVINTSKTGMPLISGCDSDVSMSYEDRTDDSYINRTWTIIESCSNRTLQLHQTLTCCQQPVIPLFLPNITIHQCNRERVQVSAPNITTDDSCCGAQSELVHNDTIINSNSSIREFQRVWTVVDACGNTASVNQGIVLVRPEECNPSRTSSTTQVPSTTPAETTPTEPTTSVSPTSADTTSNATTEFVTPEQDPGDMTSDTISTKPNASEKDTTTAAVSTPTTSANTDEPCECEDSDSDCDGVSEDGSNIDEDNCCCDCDHCMESEEKNDSGTDENTCICP